MSFLVFNRSDDGICDDLKEVVNDVLHKKTSLLSIEQLYSSSLLSRTGANSGNNEAYIQSYLKQVTQAVYCSDMINENTHVSASMMDCDEKNYRDLFDSMNDQDNFLKSGWKLRRWLMKENADGMHSLFINLNTPIATTPTAVMSELECLNLIDSGLKRRSSRVGFQSSHGLPGVVVFIINVRNQEFYSSIAVVLLRNEHCGACVDSLVNSCNAVLKRTTKLSSHFIPADHSLSKFLRPYFLTAQIMLRTENNDCIWDKIVSIAMGQTTFQTIENTDFARMEIENHIAPQLPVIEDSSLNISSADINPRMDELEQKFTENIVEPLSNLDMAHNVNKFTDNIAESLSNLVLVHDIKKLSSTIEKLEKEILNNQEAFESKVHEFNSNLREKDIKYESLLSSYEQSQSKFAQIMLDKAKLSESNQESGNFLKVTSDLYKDEHEKVLALQEEVQISAKKIQECQISVKNIEELYKQQLEQNKLLEEKLSVSNLAGKEYEKLAHEIKNELCNKERENADLVSQLYARSDMVSKLTSCLKDINVVVSQYQAKEERLLTLEKSEQDLLQLIQKLETEKTLLLAKTSELDSSSSETNSLRKENARLNSALKAETVKVDSLKKDLREALESIQKSEQATIQRKAKTAKMMEDDSEVPVKDNIKKAEKAKTKKSKKALEKTQESSLMDLCPVSSTSTINPITPSEVTLNSEETDTDGESETGLGKRKIISKSVSEAVPKKAVLGVTSSTNKKAEIEAEFEKLEKEMAKSVIANKKILDKENIPVSNNTSNSAGTRKLFKSLPVASNPIQNSVSITAKPGKEVFHNFMSSLQIKLPKLK